MHGINERGLTDRQTHDPMLAAISNIEISIMHADTVRIKKLNSRVTKATPKDCGDAI